MEEIPLCAIASIGNQDDVGSNATSIVGIPVRDYDPENPAFPDVAYRFRSDWENNDVIPNLKHYLATEAALKAAALVIGAWHGDEHDATPDAVISTLGENKDRLPELAALFVGDITSEENEISWINQTDISPLLAHFPNLQYLRARGGMGLDLKHPRHAKLRALILETGGMDVSTIRSICTSDFPSLEYLELWLGTSEYGGTSTVADLQPILSGNLFPNLKHLGLRNCEYADDVAAVLANSPIAGRVESIDLSLGVLTDEGGKALLTLAQFPNLKRLNLHYNYLTAPVIAQLKALPFEVDASKPDHMDEDEEWRFVAVGE